MLFQSGKARHLLDKKTSKRSTNVIFQGSSASLGLNGQWAGTDAELFIGWEGSLSVMDAS